MKGLILAAGYGTRMVNSAIGTKHEQLIKSLPKPLLPINNKPVVFYIYQMLKKLDKNSPPQMRERWPKAREGLIDSPINEIFLVTNAKFYSQFLKWQQSNNLSIKIINDGTTKNENRLGAIKDIELVIKTVPIDDDLLVIAGDTLLDFDIIDFIEFFQAKHKKVQPPNISKKPPVIALHQADSLEQIKQRNEIKTNNSGRITSFIEKPKNPTSLLYSAPCYIYPKSILPLFSQYIQEGQNPDAPGMFIEWLYKKIPVYGYDKIKHRFDIGNLETYQDAIKKFPTI
jgi:glucose-1-phosphate thymidylyltransferase